MELNTKVKNDWSDPDFKRKYFRDKQRAKRGDFKRHPYILDDGQRYSDVYVKDKKQVRQSVLCPICFSNYWDNAYEQHTLTEKHSYAMQVRNGFYHELIKENKWKTLFPVE